MIKRLLAMVMLLWLPLALPQPVAAQDTWHTYPCPSGTLEVGSATFEVVAPNMIRVDLPGTLACATSGQYRFGVATFFPDDTIAFVYQGMLGAYDPEGSTTFTAAFAVTPQYPLGVCLMPDPDTRLACALITVDSAGAASVSTLDITSTPATAEIMGGRVQPECNACWNVR
jgi:hypothetical protein